MDFILSPNQDDRFPGTRVEFLILHYTACDFQTALKYLTQSPSDNPVSAHYLIDTNGRTVQLVDESKRAWHAGVSRWGDYEGLNTWSVGIELVNLGHEIDYTPFPEAQIQALIPLCQEIIQRHSIPSAHVLGHSDIAPMRKKDPGERLDWKRLSKAGIGLQLFDDPKPNPFQALLAVRYLQKIGYDVGDEMNNSDSPALTAALRAFCMRCAPDCLQELRSAKVMGALKEYLMLVRDAGCRHY